MHPIWQFDALYVVSDLHLGGFGDRKIFDSSDDLERLIKHAKAECGSKSVGFVINGDFVDFLAAQDARCFDPDGAADKLDRVVGDPAFSKVFKALQAFAATDRACLIVNLGNHDLELALPWVRERLLAHLSNGNVTARGRIVVEANGEGVLCSVGNANVLCVHGNEVDTWNVTDHEALRRIGRDLQHGQAVAPWIPNAGSQLVIEVMNQIKRGKYPFVDLLKPETEGVVPALLALEPSLIGRIPSATPAAGRRIWDAVRRATGFLGPDEMRAIVSATQPRNDAPPVRQARVYSQRQNTARALLDATEQSFVAGDAPLDMLSPGDDGRMLGWKLGLAKRAVTGDVAGALREALQPLAKDRSFNPFEPDATFRDLDDSISSDVDVLIAGHTHLERILPRRGTRGIYFNTGTWARLIQVTEPDLASAASFKRFFDAFTAGTMKALDDAQIVVKRPTFASVWADNGVACAELRRVIAPANPSDPPYVAVADAGRAAWRKS